MPKYITKHYNDIINYSLVKSIQIVCFSWKINHAIFFQMSCSNFTKWQGTAYCDVIMSAMASQIISVSIVCSTVGSGADQRKHQSSASLAFGWGINRWPVNSPHKRPVTRKMFPFDDIIMYARLFSIVAYRLSVVPRQHYVYTPWHNSPTSMVTSCNHHACASIHSQGRSAKCSRTLKNLRNSCDIMIGH